MKALKLLLGALGVAVLIGATVTHSLAADGSNEVTKSQKITQPKNIVTYPREVFFPHVEWATPPIASLVPLYDAMESFRWQEAYALAWKSLAELDGVNIPEKWLIRSRIEWLAALCASELGDATRAARLMELANQHLNDGGGPEDDWMRLRVDTTILFALAKAEKRTFPKSIVPSFIKDPKKYALEFSLFHYAQALKMKNAKDRGAMKLQVSEAKRFADELAKQGDVKTASLLAGIFDHHFGR
jgi:hypothetical protein